MCDIYPLKLFSPLFYWTWSRTQSSFCCWQQIIRTDRTSLLSVHGYVCVYVCPRNNVNQISVISPVEAQTRRELVIHAVLLFTVAPILQTPHCSAFSWALPMPLESSLVKVWWLCVQQFFSTHLCPDNTSFPENPYFPEVMVGFPRCRRRETCQTGGGKGKDDNCKYPILPSIQGGKHICVWENIFIYILYF